MDYRDMHALLQSRHGASGVKAGATDKEAGLASAAFKLVAKPAGKFLWNAVKPVAREASRGVAARKLLAKGTLAGMKGRAVGVAAKATGSKALATKGKALSRLSGLSKVRGRSILEAQKALPFFSRARLGKALTSPGDLFGLGYMGFDVKLYGDNARLRQNEAAIIQYFDEAAAAEAAAKNKGWRKLIPKAMKRLHK